MLLLFWVVVVSKPLAPFLRRSLRPTRLVRIFVRTTPRGTQSGSSKSSLPRAVQPAMIPTIAVRPFSRSGLSSPSPFGGVHPVQVL